MGEKITFDKESFFHSEGYQKTIINTFKFESCYLSYNKDNRFFLPLFKINKKLISLPFATEGGINTKNAEAEKELLNKAIKLTKEQNLDYLEIRQKHKLFSPENFLLKDYYNHLVLELENEKILWNNFNKKLRNAIRKSEKLNLKVDNGVEYLDDFYNIHSRRMKELGTPVEPKSFFENLIKYNKNKIDIFVVKKDKNVISTIFLIKNKNTIKSEWGSSLKKYFGYNSAQLVYWSAIKYYCKDFKYFDFGRSVEEEGTYKFKEKFNARPQKLYYYYYLNKGNMPDTKKTNKKRMIFSYFWKKMPLFITNYLGPIIRRRFP